MKITKYPDNASYVSETKLDKQVFRLNTYEDLWHLNQFVDAFHSEYSTSTARIRPNIIVPNLIDAQADRRFNKGESSGLKLVCKFLNSLEADFKIFQPHNAEVVEALMDNVEIVDNSEFLKRVLRKVEQYNNYTDESKEKVDFSNLIILSPDAGAYKWVAKSARKIGFEGKVDSCSKIRGEEGKLKEIIIPTQDFKGRDIVLVDDISVGGGTFKWIATLLKERNCGKIYLAVSHMTIQNLGKDPITNYFDKVFTTNSKFDHYYLDTRYSPEKGFPENLEIIKLF